MKILEHTFHILEKNNQIFIPVFFHIILVQTVLSYVIGVVGVTDPELLLQSFDTLVPKFLWLALISGALALVIDSFFTSMTLSMIFEAWKKGKTKLNWSYGTKFFQKILIARIIYVAFLLLLIGALLLPVALFSISSILGILAGGAIVLITIVFFISFLWINESIVTKGLKPNAAFPYSMGVTFKNLSLTATTVLFILAFYFVAQAVVNIFAFANQVFLTTLVTLMATIFLKTLVSILKIVSFLQAK